MIELDQVWEFTEQNVPIVANAANELIMPTPVTDLDKTWVWLTLPNCGFATEVLRQLFEREGVTTQPLKNSGVQGKRFQDHTLLAVESTNETAYVDMTYLQFFGQFGLSPYLIVEAWELGLGEVMPEQHSLVYTASQLEDLTDWLTGQTLYLFDKWHTTDAWHAANGEEEARPSHEDVKAFFGQIYDPAGYTPFSQTPEKQMPIVTFLDTYEPGKMSIEALARAMRYKLISRT